MYAAQMPAPPRSQRGSALLTVTLFILVLGGLSVGLLTESLAEKGQVTLRHDSLRALEICETGLVKASLEIRAQKDSRDDGIGVVSGEHAGGTFDVRAIQDAGSPDRWILTAMGTYNGIRRRVEVGLRRRAGSQFVEGLFSKDTLTFDGNTQTDAYDSRLGAYALQAVNTDGSGTYAEGGGHVGSNTGIVLHGASVAIRGNAIPGPQHAVSMSGNPVVWGDMMPRRVRIELLPTDRSEFEAAFLVNDNAELLPPAKGNAGGNGKGNGAGAGGSTPPTASMGTYDPQTHDLTASGQTHVVLSGGTYFFRNVRLTGQSTLTVDGPTTLYVIGDLDVSGGGFVNASGVPSDLKVFAHPYPVGGLSTAGSTLKIRGGAQAAMALYAPGADLSVAGGDDVYGSFVASTITIAGGGRFHYDKALGDPQGHVTVVLERLYWRDLDEQLRQ